MKKQVLVYFIVFCFVVTSVMAKETKQRYLVKSENAIVQSMFGVQHNFKNGFTTEITQNQLNILNLLDIGTEEIAQYTITGKPDRPPGKSKKCMPTTQIPYGIEMVNGGSGGDGINVAVLDTGIFQRHPDLRKNIKDCKDFTGLYSDCGDRNGHGTHVAGTIAANGNILGVAPHANIFAYKVCNHKGGCFTDDIATGIIYATDNGADIISMSLGGSSQSLLVKDAIDYATDNGVLVIAAAGNYGAYGNDTIIYPAANPKVIAVGAIDKNMDIAFFSSIGIDDGDDSVISERELELSAPGVNVESTFNDGCYTTYDGTSMATPHIAGLAAKLWSGTQTRSYLRSLALDVHSLGYDTVTGYGVPIAP